MYSSQKLLVLFIASSVTAFACDSEDPSDVVSGSATDATTASATDTTPRDDDATGGEPMPSGDDDDDWPGPTQDDEDDWTTTWDATTNDSSSESEGPDDDEDDTEDPSDDDGGETSDDPNEGVVACGNTTCDLATSVCCVGLSGSSCSAPGSCGFLEAEVSCDGPEDCDGDQRCCAGFPQGASCQNQCTGSNFDLCHSNADCPGAGDSCLTCSFPGGADQSICAASCP